MKSNKSNIRDFTHFSPNEYLNEYYHSVFSENDKLLHFLASVAEVVPQGSTLLEYGGGPTIYQIISFAPRVSTIHFTDYLPENIEAVQDWLNTEAHAHDWKPFVDVALQHEGIKEPTNLQIEERENLVRKQLHSFGHVDAFNIKNDNVKHQAYDVVSANFVAESIAFDDISWRAGLDSILSYVKPGGLLSMTAIRGATYWMTGNKKFPAYYVDAKSLNDELTLRGYEIQMLTEIDAEITDVNHQNYEGYDGMVFLLAKKK